MANTPGPGPGPEPEVILDLRGYTCPTTTDRTVKALALLGDEQVLEVCSDYYPARTTIPYHCHKRGYEYSMSDPDKHGVWRVQIKRKKEV